jgi:trimethylamine---corrinoid protein Co-methyltransferase
MQIKIQTLSEAEKADIHERSLDILIRTGMRIQTARGRKILEEAGAKVNQDTNIVRFPQELVERSLKSAPNQFKLGGRRPGWEFQMNQGNCTMCFDGEGISTIDRKTGEIRDSNSWDLWEITRIGDAIDEVGIFWCAVTPNDYQDTLVDYLQYQINVFKNFSKHVQDPFKSPQQVPWFLEILQTIFGDKETIRREHPYSTLLCPQSPLEIQEEYTNAILDLKGWNIPVTVMPMALMGATAPASMVSTLTQVNCEILGSLCLLQANEPGVPFIYAPIPSLIDPRSCRYFCGGIENSVMTAASVEMAKYYNLPVLATSLGTDSFYPSMQGGIERAMNVVLPSAANPDIIIGPGLLGGNMILSHEQFVIDVEIFRMSRQLARGIDTGKSSWLDQAILEVGSGGNYLTHPSTAKRVRGNEWYLPQMGVHCDYEKWKKGEKRSLVEEAREKVDQIIENHQLIPFDEKVELELAKIVKKAAEATKSLN